MGLATIGTGNIYVEDGTGYSNADSLVSVEYADTFFGAVSRTSDWVLTITDPTVKGSALRKATMEWFEGQMNGLLRGTISDKSQSLSLPRIGLYDDEGRSWTSNEIPDKIKQAICWVAFEIAVNGASVLPSEVVRGAVITEETKKLGTMVKTTKWSGAGNPSESSLVRFQAAEALIYPFADGSDQNSVTVF